MAQKYEESKTTVASDVKSHDGGEKSTNAQTSDSSSNSEQTKSNEIENQETTERNGIASTENNMDAEEQSDSSDGVKSFTSKLTAANLQDKIKNFLRSELKQPNEKSSEPDAASKINSEFYLDDEYTEHYLPQQIDTSDVIGEMVQVRNILHFTI